MPEATESRPLTVALVISNLEFGGSQRQVIELANAAFDSDAVAVNFHIVSLSDCMPLAKFVRDGIPIHVIPKKQRFDLSVVWRLRRLLRSLGADVVHGYLFDAEIAARLAGRLAGVPVMVGSERNTDYEISRVQQLAYRATRGMRDFCIANSSAGARFNAQALDYPEEHYRVIYNGVDTNRFRPADRQSALRAQDLNDEHFWIGMFASFKPRKNHAMLLKAAKKLIERAPDIRIMLIGDLLANKSGDEDGYRESISKLVDELGLAAVIQQLGNRNDVESMYPCCDLTVLTSVIEGTPNVLLESMACGIPIVATDVADNAVVAPDGKVGRIVPLDDVDAFVEAVLGLKMDDSKRQQSGQAARRWACDQFSVASLAENTSAAYRDFYSQKARN